jgi:hypothetical protein
MATSLVNLDALIARDDFLVVGAAAEGSKTTTLRITDLEKGAFFHNALRKPDFQRETANWSPDKIQEFVRTFLDGDLIPAVILWSAGGSNIFIIDGAHRLSALIAWVWDDYGDGTQSLDFFHNSIPSEQKRAAEKTRQLIGATIGTYEEHKKAIQYPESSKPEVKQRAIRLGSVSIDVQWVPTTDLKRAEAAFFKINQAVTQIDPTELRILNARFSPPAIAARVIMRKATGHKYWGKFDAPIQQQIETLGRDIYESLFLPPLDTPIKTLDLPVAGRGYSGQTLPLIFDLANIANELPVADLSKKNVQPVPPPSDIDGSATVKMLKRTQALTRRITGIHPSSLGLHPAVYFYSATGRYQPTAFLAIASMLMDFEANPKAFKDFTARRKLLEDFLIKSKNFINQITTKFGSAAKGFTQVKNFYLHVLTSIGQGLSEGEIIESLKQHATFNFLKPFEPEEPAGLAGKGFSTPVKSATFLSAALSNPLRCKLCEGLIHFNSIQVDHIKKLANGGLDVKDNAQLAHPYCNSTIKG